MKLPNKFKLTDSDDTQKLPPSNPTRPLPPLSEPPQPRITVNAMARAEVVRWAGFLAARPKYQRFSRGVLPDRFDEKLIGWLNGVEVWLEEQAQ